MMNGTPSIPALLRGTRQASTSSAPSVFRASGAASVRMTTHVLELADRYGFTSIAPRDPDRLAGTVAVNVPDALPVSRTLKARDFIVDYRPAVGVRVSPHFYNTVEEIDRIMAEMASIVAKKDYATADTGSRVT